MLFYKILRPRADLTNLNRLLWLFIVAIGVTTFVIEKTKLGHLSNHALICDHGSTNRTHSDLLNYAVNSFNLFLASLMLIVIIFTIIGLLG